jgi:hypothetical protein
MLDDPIEKKETIMARHLFRGWLYKSPLTNMWFGELDIKNVNCGELRIMCWLFTISSNDLEIVIEALERELNRKILLEDQGYLGYGIL